MIHKPQLIDSIISAGSKKLFILSDFDKTLTYGFKNGIKIPSIISLLRDGNHLTKDYATKANALFAKYSPLENDAKLSKAERQKYMHEWWQSHFQLLIESKLNKKDIKDIVEKGTISFKKSVPEILDLLHQKDIPLIVYSASGCGDAIPMFFEQIHKKYSNVFFVINRFKWDSNGNAVSTLKPLITAANKNGSIIKNFPEIIKSIEYRTNIILLGDSLDDVEMADGIESEVLLKIGLLNNDEKKNQKNYSLVYDVLLDDARGLEYLRDLLKKLK